MLNNRQGNNNRRRGRNNNNQRPQANNNSRNDNGSRIDNRARGNAPQMLEKYKTLARDAQMQGDRVLTEYYHQFADHYFRVVAEARTRFEESRPRRDDWEGGAGEDGHNDNRNSYDDTGGDDTNFEDGRTAPPQRQYRDDRAEADAQRDEPESREMREERTPREQQARPARYERTPRETKEERAPRAERQPFERQPRRQRFEQIDEAAQADAPLTLDLGVLPPAIAPMPEASDGAALAPKRRGRPKKVADTENA